jgi:hypothetical protein
LTNTVCVAVIEIIASLRKQPGYFRLNFQIMVKPPQIKSRFMTNLIVFGLVFIVSLALCGYFMSRMPGRSLSGPLPELTASELRLKDHLHAHVEMLAGKIGERNVWQYDNLQRAAEYIEGSFKQAGLNTRLLPYESVGKTVYNIEAEIPGLNGSSGIIVVGAHYDSLVHTSGANDNGSGVAALLELAHLFKDSKPSKTVRFVAFVNEEPPFFKTSRMGSWVYARQALQSGDRLVSMISLETIGYYTREPLSQRFPLPMLRYFYPDRGDFVALVGNFRSGPLLKRSVKAFRQKGAFPSEGIVAPGWLLGVDWSDHWSFWKIGCPAIMATDTALFRYPHYHAVDDTPDKLNYEALTRVVSGLEAMIGELAK